jgi:hypothetical protein
VTTALIALAVVLALTVAILTYELHGMPRLRRRCIVNLRGEGADTIEGVLWTRRGRWLVLKDARLLHRDEPPVPADGEVLIDRDQIHFLQVL